MIELVGLEVRAGGFRVGPIDFRLPPGAYGVLLGPSGAGKSLVLEAIAGVRTVKAGDVRLEGRSIVRRPPERRGVGLVFQDGLLFPHLTVAGNIAYGTKRSRGRWRWGVRGDAAVSAEVERQAAATGVDGLLDRFPSTLSGGERQRVALARALAARPSLLLLDEPLSAVDGGAREALRDVLQRVNADTGLTVLHVTHDLDEAVSVGTHCAVIADGRVLQVGAPEDVVRRPASREVAQFVRAGNVLDVAPTADPLTVLLAATGRPLRVGSPCPPGVRYAVIRSETISIVGVGAPARAEENALVGVVRRTVVGATRTTVEVDCPPRFLVRTSPTVSLQEGLTVSLRFRAQAVHLI